MAIGVAEGLPLRHGAARDGSAGTKRELRLIRVLDAAYEVFLNEGYDRLTMRKVAAIAGMSHGNLNYYFPRKEHLLRALFDYVIDGHLAEFERRQVDAGGDPERQLEAILDYWLDDGLSRETTIFLMEMWARSNRDDNIAAMTDQFYRRARQPLATLIVLINPSLNEQEAAQIALLMCASMEWLMVFAGHDRPYLSQYTDLKRLLIPSLLRMIRG